jgi:hypothetical protein
MHNCECHDVYFLPHDNICTLHALKISVSDNCFLVLISVIRKCYSWRRSRRKKQNKIF